MKTKIRFIYLLIVLFAASPFFAGAQCNANNLTLPSTYSWTATGPGEVTISWDAQPDIPYWLLYFRIKKCDGIWEPFPVVVLDGSATSYVFNTEGLEIFTSFIKASCEPNGPGSLGQTTITPSDQNHWVYLDCNPCPNFTIVPLCGGWSGPPNFPTMCSDFCADNITHLVMLIEQTNPPGPIALDGTTWRGANDVGQIIWYSNGGTPTLPSQNGMTLSLASMGWTVDDVSYATVDYFFDGNTCEVPMPDWNCFLGPGDGARNWITSPMDYSKNDLINEVVLSPNPVTNYLNVNIPEKLAVVQIEVIDASGKIIESLDQSTRQINFSAFEQGVYFVRFLANDGNVVKRVVKY